MLDVDPRNAVPIWKQIEEEIRRLVAVGTFPAGAAVPSVRDMAQRLRVNPATVARAYQRLADQGVLMVRRGEGTFVSSAPASVPRREREQMLETAARKYAAVSAIAGATPEQALEHIRKAFEEMNAMTRGER